MSQRWQGRCAVITGAASGLGWALAQAAAQRGMRLVLADVNVGVLQQRTQELQGMGVEVLACATDVSQLSQVQALARAAEQAFGVVHLVFNNAGVLSTGLLWESSEQEWARVLGVNLMGVVHGVQAFTPGMLQAAQVDADYCGVLVNTASMAGLVCAPNMGVYNVSKHAVVALTETLLHDLRLVGDQVRAAVLCPYFVPTSIADQPGEPDAALTPSQRIGQDMARQAVQAGKVSASEVAELVFEALQAGRFYIYSHPQTLGGVEQRCEDLLQGTPPRDPLAARPQLGERLRQAIGAGKH